MSSPTRRQMLQSVLAGLTSGAVIKPSEVLAAPGKGKPAQMEALKSEGAGAPSSGAVYKTSSIPIEQRVRDLLSPMTLEEKVEQISGGRRGHFGIVDTTG